MQNYYTDVKFKWVWLLDNLIQSDISYIFFKFRCIIIFAYLFHFRRNKSINKTALDVSGNLLFCWKKSIYQDVVVKAEEGSTYQELNLSENAYQNVAVQWSTHIQKRIKTWIKTWHLKTVENNTYCISK